MFRFFTTICFVGLIAPTIAAAADTLQFPVVVEAQDHDDLVKKWCAADPSKPHVFVLPASLFVDSEYVSCDSGAYKLYRVVDADDPDDFEYYLDPPFGKQSRLACDGKAGRAMEVIAVNCRTV